MATLARYAVQAPNYGVKGWLRCCGPTRNATVTTAPKDYSQQGVAVGETREGRAFGSLGEGFKAQRQERYSESLKFYRDARQDAKTPLIAMLSHNAEGLLLWRSPDNLERLESSDPNAAPECSVGMMVLAPWAQDGGQYLAKVSEINADTGKCLVTWEDADSSHRTVPVAALTTVTGGALRGSSNNAEARAAWSALWALWKAFDAYLGVAKAGGLHDRFVDAVGVLNDIALLEAHVALQAGGNRQLGLERGLHQLKRALFMAERAWQPDPRCLAVTCAHQAEMLRLQAQPEGKRTDLKDVLKLQVRAAQHASQALWFSGPGKGWQCINAGCGIGPAVIQELLWAKALATQAAWHGAQFRNKRSLSPKAPAQNHIRLNHGVKPQRKKSLQNVLYTGRREQSWSLPEKLFPNTQPLPQAYDALLDQDCPAIAAVARAWRALRSAANRDGVSSPPPPALECLGGRSALIAGATPEEGQRLARALRSGPASAALLLEVAVITFAMGCSLGRGRTAQAVAAVLVEEAAARLPEVGTLNNACHSSAELAGAVKMAINLFTGTPLHQRGPGKVPMPASRLDAMRSPDNLALGEQLPPTARLRQWKIAAYHPAEELWVFQLGAHGMHQYLLAPRPLSWCLEGLALSEGIEGIAALRDDAGSSSPFR